MIDTETQIADEVEVLRRENARLRGDRAAKRRKLVVGLLVALGGIAALAAHMGVWLDRTLLDTDDYVAAVAPLPADEDVVEAVTTAVVDDLFATVDVEAEAGRLLPPDPSFAAAPLSNALEDAAADVAREVVGSGEFQQIWVAAQRLAHEETLALLRGESVEPLVVENGAVTLDLSDLAHSVAGGLGDAAGPLLGELPDDAGQVVLFRDDQLAAAQTAVNVMDTLALVLPALAVGLFGLAVFASRERRRTLMTVGVTIAATTALSLVGVEIARSYVVGSIGDATNQAAVSAAWDIVQRGFVNQSILVLIAGVAVVAIAWASGAGPRAVAVRDMVRAGLDRIGSNQPALRWGLGIAAVVALLLWPGVTFGAVLLVVVLAVAVAAVMAAVVPRPVR